MTCTARRGSTPDSKAGAQLHLVMPVPLVLWAGMPSFPSPVLLHQSCPSMSPSSCLSHGEDGGGNGTGTVSKRGSSENTEAFHLWIFGAYLMLGK